MVNKLCVIFRQVSQARKRRRRQRLNCCHCCQCCSCCCKHKKAADMAKATVCRITTAASGKRAQHILPGRQAKPKICSINKFIMSCANSLSLSLSLSLDSRKMQISAACRETLSLSVSLFSFLIYSTCLRSFLFATAKVTAKLLMTYFSRFNFSETARRGILREWRRLNMQHIHFN